MAGMRLTMRLLADVVFPEVGRDEQGERNRISSRGRGRKGDVHHVQHDDNNNINIIKVNTRDKTYKQTRTPQTRKTRRGRPED
jgi:hypothetical protein